MTSTESRPVVALYTSPSRISGADPWTADGNDEAVSLHDTSDTLACESLPWDTKNGDINNCVYWYHVNTLTLSVAYFECNSWWKKLKKKKLFIYQGKYIIILYWKL